MKNKDFTNYCTIFLKNLRQLTNLSLEILKNKDISELQKFNSICCKKKFKNNLEEMFRLKKTLSKKEIMKLDLSLFMINFYNAIEYYDIVDLEYTEVWPYRITANSVNEGLQLNKDRDLKLFLVCDNITFDNLWVRAGDNRSELLSLIEKLYRASIKFSVLMSMDKKISDEASLKQFFIQFNDKLDGQRHDIKIHIDNMIQNYDTTDERKKELNNEIDDVIHDVMEAVPKKDGSLDNRQLIMNLMDMKSKNKVNDMIKRKANDWKSNPKQANNMIDIVDAATKNMGSKMNSDPMIRGPMSDLNKKLNKIRANGKFTGKNKKLYDKFMKVLGNISN